MNAISWDQSIRDFIQQAGSSAPTPGGGSVAALVAALGASMTAMVGNLSQGDKFVDVHEQIAAAIRVMNDLTAACEELLASDIAAFQQYMEALRLPKQTAEEKDLRSQAIQAATAAAITVPLRLMEVCRDGLRCTLTIAENSNKNVISDLGIGAILFEAAAQSANLTIEINLASLKDSEARRQYMKQMLDLISAIEELKSKTLLAVRSRIIG
ncbi:cyclodeaminase/cyclohydrolase family protein [Paenibacillus sp. SI8]|uniref:cyclodeaminase/cyclohydrolase family protein n=1 Tax=unclassified Paenibacillus TaxID=185978 RepID=UPI0034671151